MEKEKIKTFDYWKHENIDIEIPNTSKIKYLEERNKKYMNNIAMTFDKRKITYEEFHQRVDEYAKALYKRGVRQGDFIGLCAVNTPEAIFTMYALDKIGAVTIGLSPLNNKYQMRRDLEMTRPKMVITADMLYGNIKPSIDDLNISPILFSPVESMQSPLVRALYSLKQAKAGNRVKGKESNLSKIVKNNKDAESVFQEVMPNYVSDIMFTGGSTGVHKGVELYGDGFNSLVNALDYVFFLEPGQKHLGNVPVNHMVFGKALTHYVLGSNLEYDLTLKMTPEFFTEEVVRTKANGIMGGPIHFENMIDNPMIKEGSLSFVQQAVSGGEHFKAKKKMAAEAALRIGGSKAIIGNAIGSTETESVTHISIMDTRQYTDMSSYPFNIDYEKEPVTCGYPIPGIQYKIVDLSTGEEVQKGENGTLFLSGPTIMKGYYKNDKENKKVFSYDETGTRWFNQGDIVHNTGENFEEMEFAGRVKRNFVSNITNIYPEEIESMLLKFSEIREVIVAPIPDDRYQFLPKYHISLYSECNLEDLKNKITLYIQETLGDDALPGYYEFTYEPFPRTDNGKMNTTLIAQNDLKLYEENKKLGKVLKKER